MDYTIQNFIHGSFQAGTGEQRELISPLNESTLGCFRDSTADDVQKAIEIAKKAQKDWGALTTRTRVEVHYAYRSLLKKRRDELAEICHLENGKTMDEARAGVDKAIELTDFACSMPQMISGKAQEVSLGIECKFLRVPLGAVASIAPFNFPVMVPHWTVPNALAVGNAMILKPSEFTPISALRSAELWKEAGLPDGLLNVVLGTREVVEELCDNEGIKALTFVGSTSVAQLVYRRASQNLKRVRTFGGAKNYLLIAEDAHPLCVRDIMASFCGMAGQRCMAASVFLEVGNAQEIIEGVMTAARRIAPGKDFPPLIHAAARDKILTYLDNANKEGAKIILDGREFPVPEKGCYIGPSIIDWRGIEERMPMEEVFGPVLEILHADTLSQAIQLQNRTPYGNAASIFTQSGRVAHDAMRGVRSGMKGVNIGIPVPREPFSFGGIAHSRFGEGGITGWSNVEFFTDSVKITTKWNPEDKRDWMS